MESPVWLSVSGYDRLQILLGLVRCAGVSQTFGIEVSHKARIETLSRSASRSENIRSNLQPPISLEAVSDYV
jgi:hypothetical protein